MATRVDPKIWKAMAGPLTQLPTVNSTVYYFPRGHLEEAAGSPLELHELINNTPPNILCTVTSVDLLASQDTDGIFTKISLQPGSKTLKPSPQHDKIVSFAKTLFPNEVCPFDQQHVDALCSIPDSIADSIFPPLSAMKRHQNVIVTDIHGKNWKFVHRYRIPSSHVIFDGWTEFATEKKLNAGDSIVFMKNSNGKIIIGIRRIKKPSFRPELVEEAVRLAMTNSRFDVAYAPSTNAGWSDFVVRVEDVQRAIRFNWSPGNRVTMPVVCDDPKGLNWFLGTIYSRNLLHKNCLWHRLQIKWDLTEEKSLKEIEWVSPWQLKHVENSNLSLRVPTPKVPQQL